ncbi:MAG: sugar kinase [Actinomycetota bacterium]|nr:MAG: sugar kinase [Actinomycetota bacterium]
MSDIVVLLEDAPDSGSTRDARIRTRGGGSGANTAAWLSHEGHATAYVGKVGDDGLGQHAKRDLAACGVDVHIAVDPLEHTGTCVVLVGPDGERTMLPDAGANGSLTPADLPEPLFVGGAHLHLSGYTLLHEGSRMAGLAALDQARRRGMTASVDPSSFGPLRDIGVARFLSWVDGVDLLLANREEACALAGEPDPETAGRSLAESFGTVVVTLGPDGALWLTRGAATVSAPTLAVDVVDTTGAGDAFTAGLLPAWVDGAEPALALAMGNRLASRAVSTVGARP